MLNAEASAETCPQALFGMALIQANKIASVTTVIDGKTSYEWVYRKKPNMKKLNLHVWFCPVFYGLTLVQRMALGGNLKAATRAKAGRFVGSHGPTLYVYVPDERKIRRVSYTKVWFMEAEYTEKTDMSAILQEGEGDVTMTMSDHVGRVKSLEDIDMTEVDDTGELANVDGYVG